MKTYLKFVTKQRLVLCIQGRDYRENCSISLLLTPSSAILPCCVCCRSGWHAKIRERSYCRDYIKALQCDAIPFTLLPTSALSVSISPEL